MKSWLPVLTENLEEGPVLALAGAKGLAKAALFDAGGGLLAGSLGDPRLQALAAEKAPGLALGEALVLADDDLMLERLSPDEKTRTFWRQARDLETGAWAAWLLTIPKGDDKLSRHFLSAFGPWTTPRLPEEVQGRWSLLPISPGVGRLFIFGDDALALETAGLAGRAGMTVTLITTAEPIPGDLAEARAMGDFTIATIAAWAEVTPEFLAESGVAAGVLTLVTCPEADLFVEAVRELKPRYLGLAGQAPEAASPAGPFAKAATTSLAALGLIAEMLS